MTTRSAVEIGQSDDADHSFQLPTGAESFAGSTATIPVRHFFSPLDSHSSVDGVRFADSENSSAGGGSLSLTWVFQGKP